MIFLRHTAPAGGAGLCYGRTDLDVGPDFAEAATAILRDLPAVAAIGTSPARRCRRLAAAIGAARGLAVAADPRLAEIDFGVWEGRAWDAIPRGELEAWAADLLGARPHGGESVAMLKARVAAAVTDWQAMPGPVLLVTHAGVIRAARALSGASDPWTGVVGYGVWIEA